MEKSAFGGHAGGNFKQRQTIERNVLVRWFAFVERTLRIGWSDQRA
jgi:hypothetical protein